MKKFLLMIALSALGLGLNAQTDDVAKEVANLAKESKKTVTVADSLKNWHVSGMLSLTAFK
ncbi:MAG: hypothetical protein IIU11_10680 [Bacteroidales bacterium]|nr:hypothetical protein [Bacteroidales bacterium]